MFEVLLVALVAVFLTTPANGLVRWVLARVAAVNQGAVRAGRWIGGLERLLIYTLVLTGEPAAAGLVVAAKSILRYPEISGEHPAIKPEYVLVGSLTSWLLAFAAGGWWRWRLARRSSVAGPFNARRSAVSDRLLCPLRHFVPPPPTLRWGRHKTRDPGVATRDWFSLLPQERNDVLAPPGAKRFSCSPLDRAKRGRSGDNLLGSQRR